MPLDIDQTTELSRKAQNIFDLTIQKKGFVPNVLSVYGSRSELLGGIAELSGAFGEGQLSDAEREIVFLSTSVANKCRYCVAGHTYYALEAGIDADDVNRMRQGDSLHNPSYEALRAFSQTLALGRGHSATKAQERFQRVGYTRSQTLDVIVGVATKTLSNMTASLLALPLDSAFEPYAWSPKPEAFDS